MRLSNRLMAIAAMVPECETVADIGCDHGKLAVWLLKNGKAKRAVCGDISAPSLDKARRLAADEKLSDAVSLREGSGFDVLEPGEVQVAVLAGMGGELMVTLLAQGADRLPETLVLACHRDVAAVRQWLSENDYFIEDEDIVLENRRYYPVLRARRGVSRPLTQAEIEFGPVLLCKKTKLFTRYVNERVAKQRAVRAALSSARSARRDELIAQADKTLKLYEEVAKCLQV